MSGEYRTKEKLINQLIEMRRRNVNLGRPEANREDIEKKLRQYLDYSEGLVLKRSDELTDMIGHLLDELAERRRIEAELRHRLDFEELIASISTDFMGLSIDEIDYGIEQVLRIMGEFFCIDHSHVFIFFQNGMVIENVYEWCAEGMERQMSGLNRRLFSAKFPWLAEKMEKFEVINISCVADLPPEAHSEKEHFRKYGIQSLLEVPMVYGGSLIGFLGLGSTQTERSWGNDIIALLKIVESILANALGRREAELSLRDSELKYRVLVENTNEAIIVIKDGMIDFLNSRTVELIGYSESELTSMLFQDFIHPDDQEILPDHRLRDFKSEEFPASYTFRIINRDGDIIWVESNTLALMWEGNPNSAILHFLTDITERKRMEEELIKVEKLESLGVLAGGIAHDFNNILTAILGNVSLAGMYLESGMTPGKITKRLREAERASMQARELTQQLLTFSRGGEPVKELAAIGEILRDAATFASRGSNAACEFSIPDDLWPAEIDPGQINQVINNIVINACQAMPEGGTVKLRAENVSVKAIEALPLANGEYIKLSISDQGVGMPESIVQKIFDPFFTTKQAGNGLGLATSYSIIQKHDGYISAESEMGVGTTFHIYLPASTAEMPLADKTAEEASIMGEGRILVMDDEKHIRDLITAVLSKLGYSVSTSVDGAEAVKLYGKAQRSRRPYDVVIMDLTIPGGMGGMEAMALLKEINPGVRAIVSSGYSNDPIMANFREYGFQGVIAKPYKITELSEILHKVVSES